MADNLFHQLKRIGIDDDLACKVSASLDPDYNASKKDVLIMQEAILQVQARTDERNTEQQAQADKRYYELQAQTNERYHELQEQTNERYHELQTRTDNRYYELKTEMIKGFSDIRKEITDVRSEVGSMHRQYWITFGTLIISIASVLAINWYYHL